MKRLVFITFLLGLTVAAFAQQKSLLSKPEFNGYIQIRAVSNMADYNSFMVRRLKLWIKSEPQSSHGWFYKVQTTLTSKEDEKFFLQDVKLGYKAGQFSLDVGQFVPQYSLERFESDYKIPTLERAKVINCLIPDGTLGVRDLGAQVNYHTKNKLIETHLGIFNGYGIKEYRFHNQGFMITHKTELNLPMQNSELKLGYSLQYRQAENLALPKILPDTISYTGSDVRYDLFAMFKTSRLWLQAEYLSMYLGQKRTWGYYVFSAFNVHKSQFVASYEYYKDLIPQTADLPAFRLGYNYLLNSYKLRLSLDNYFQLDGYHVKNYLLSLQLQVFLK